MIVAGCLGLYGYTFLDFGPTFRIFDANGEEPKSVIIANITQGNPGIVTVHEDKRHPFNDEDSITFKEIEGMTEINN